MILLCTLSLQLTLAASMSHIHAWKISHEWPVGSHLMQIRSYYVFESWTVWHKGTGTDVYLECTPQHGLALSSSQDSEE